MGVGCCRSGEAESEMSVWSHGGRFPVIGVSFTSCRVGSHRTIHLDDGWTRAIN